MSYVEHKGQDMHRVAERAMHGASSPYDARRDGIADGVSWGFKAPVSMALFPLLAGWHGPLKLIHVVRDGRDVAISGNQSPVEKFWGTTYGPGDKQRSKYEAGGKYVMAAALWSKWNADLFQWARNHEDIRGVRAV